MTTKKVKITGKYGSKYGVGIRKRVLAVLENKNKKIPCPVCGTEKVVRKTSGIYNCKKCLAEFTGGAYSAVTMMGNSVKKIVSQKAFASSAELLEQEIFKEGLETNVEGTVKVTVEGTVKVAVKDVAKEKMQDANAQKEEVS